MLKFTDFPVTRNVKIRDETVQDWSGFPDWALSTADDWPKVLSLRTLLVRSVQHLVTYTKMFVCMSSFRIRLMTSSLMSTNRVTALEPYITIITDY